MVKVFLFVVAFLLSSSEAVAINFFRCETNEDCAKVYIGCGRYGSVHKRYKELYEAKARKGDTVSFCRAPEQKDKELREKGVFECKKKACRLYLPESKSSS